MMGLDDFGLSMLASWLANKMEDLFRPSMAEEQSSNTPPPLHTTAEAEPKDVRRPKFKTFDAWNDLPKLLKVVKDPLISILIEDEPSTHYRLPSLVLESRVTGEWFVFYRGRMSFEGSGGGIRNSRDILDQVKAAGAAVGVWVVPQNLLNDLDNGYALWPAIRHMAVPLLAIVAQDHSWSEIESNVAKYL